MLSEKIFYVYAIVSHKDHRIYVGMAMDPQKRLLEHNQGKTTSTKRYTPWQLFFTRKAFDRKHARELERYYKSGSGKQTLKENLNQFWSRSSTDTCLPSPGLALWQAGNRSF